MATQTEVWASCQPTRALETLSPVWKQQTQQTKHTEPSSSAKQHPFSAFLGHFAGKSEVFPLLLMIASKILKDFAQGNIIFFVCGPKWLVFLCGHFVAGPNTRFAFSGVSRRARLTQKKGFAAEPRNIRTANTYWGHGR